ncbi:MAG TPA: helix-turn-helix transcriptional regulator [Anaerolineales bacterium]
MDTRWRERLVQAIESDGRTPRAISLAANLGPNFISQMLERGTSPSTQALVSLCGVLGVSLTYIFTGAEMSPEDEDLLRLAAVLPEKQKDLLIEMARQLQDGGPR